jgi:hypothetical protein
MGKPLPLTLLRVINSCHLYDTSGMSHPDDTTKTLSKHRGSLCYIPPCLSVDDLVDRDEQVLRQSVPERATPLNETCQLSRHTLATPTVVNSSSSLRGKPFRCSKPQHRIEVNRSRFPGTGELVDPGGSDISLGSVTGS